VIVLKILLLIVCIAVFSLLQASSAQSLEKVTLQLQWKYQFQFAGFIVAKERGYYREEGLDVTLVEYNNTNIIQELLDKKSDFVLSNSIVLHRDRKLQPISLLATYFQRSPLIIITQPEIKNTLGLRGKKVMLSENDLKNSSLSMMLKYFDINRKNTTFIPQTFRLDEFINRDVDAVAAFKSNEVFELKQKKIPHHIIDPVEYGFSTNAINLFATYKTIDQRPELVHKFLKASKKGWEYALEHRNEVARLIHEKYQKNKSLELLEHEAKVTQEMMMPDLYDIGEINNAFIEKTFKQLVRSEKLKADQTQERLIYHDHINEKKDKIALSQNEKKWLKEHPIITYSEVNWKPLSIIENDAMEGIMGDYLKLIAERTGIIFKYIPSNSWPEVLEAFKEKKIDIVPGVGSSPQEMALGAVTNSYVKYPMVIVTGNEYSFLDSLADIKDKRIAVPKGYTSYNFIVENYPEMALLSTGTIEEALLLVQAKKADAFVGHIATSLYALSKLNMTDLKVSGTTDFEFEHRYLIQEEYPELKSIINKVFRSISETQRNDINARWIRTKVEERLDMSVIWGLIATAVFIIIIFLTRQYSLKQYNQQLEKLKERMDLALDGTRDALWDLDLLSLKLYMSPRWKDITGYREPNDVYVMKQWRRHIHPDDLRNVLQHVSNSLKADGSYLDVTYRLQHRNSQWIWIRTRGKTHYDKNGVAVRMTGTHTDVTQERELQLKYNQQAQMIEQTHDSVISTDLEGFITHWNRGSQLLLEYEEAEMIGKPVSMIYPKEDHATLLENIEILKVSAEVNTTVRLVKKSGTIIFADLSLSMLRDEHGKAYGMVGYSQDITERKRAEDILVEQKNLLDYQAHHDPLTGLPNRTLFIDRMYQGIEKAKRNRKELALFFIDLDHFKQINDSLGHDIGDEVLRIVTQRISAVIRNEDTLSRLGGDEFTVIIENLDNAQDASLLAEKILQVLKEVIEVATHKLYVSGSIGISIYPRDEENVMNLLKAADAAMYRAKDEGRNNYQFYSVEMTELAFERVVMETSLRQAIEREEFIVYYQPQIDTLNDTIVGLEALVRWNHPLMGLVSPAKFIPLAEDTGLIVEVDRLVMKQAMQQMVSWYAQGLNPGKIALNLAIKQLESPHCVSTLVQTMQTSGFKAQWLEFEMTESDVMKNPDQAIIKLKEIHALGIAIAVDDFGTGYSSLSYLKRFAITKLKIDQSFVRDIPSDEEDSAIVKAIIALGKSLNLKLIAEGVETQEQKEFLLTNGCHHMQGYLYSRPVSAQEMTALLEAGFNKQG
jgi:diguanylate cyclase (GGDEF)-like protein/PAS domain S-box-containing protein